MVEYIIKKISSSTFGYNCIDNYISISSSKKVMDSVNELEYSEYIADSLTHEYMHHILFKLYGVTVCGLFDTIQQHFRNTQLHEKIIKIENTTGDKIKHMSHTDFIKLKGFKAFLDGYNITQSDINNAKLTCNQR